VAHKTREPPAYYCTNKKVPASASVVACPSGGTTSGR